MSDTLRTRIATVLRTGMFETSTAEELADAVIAELQLGKEFGCGTSDSRHGCRCSHRYVTEWETAE